MPRIGILKPKPTTLKKSHQQEQHQKTKATKKKITVHSAYDALYKTLRFTYTERLFTQASYVMCVGAHETKSQTILFADPVIYQNDPIDYIKTEWDEWTVKTPDYSRAVELKTCKDFLVDHKCYLEKLGLPNKLTDYLGQNIIFKIEEATIYAEVASITFIRERKEECIKICPRNIKCINFTTGKKSGELRQVHYFQFKENGIWTAFHKGMEIRKGDLLIY